MSHRLDKPTVGIGAQLGAALFVVVIFALIGFVALSVVTGNDFGAERVVGLANPQSVVTATPPVPFGTPNPRSMANYKDTALGFSLQYPRYWRKKQSGLRVVLSPTGAGFRPR